MSITLTKSAIERVKEIRQKESNQGKFLRVGVSGGGCSGFQYLFDLDNKLEDVSVGNLEINLENPKNHVHANKITQNGLNKFIN